MNETITIRKDGRYELKLSLGLDKNGKRERKSFYGKSKKEVLIKKEEWLKNCYSNNITQRLYYGDMDSIGDITFSQWADAWLNNYKKDNVRQYTFEFTYKARVEKYLKPHFGNRILKAITPVDIQIFFNKHKDLSIDLLKTLRVILNGIFNTAIDNDICAKNPVTNVILKSTYKKVEKQILNKEEQRKAINWAIKNNHIDILTVLKTGLRRGELLGLRWQDIDFNNLVILINESISPKINGKIDCELKTKSSQRIIPIDKELATCLNNIPRLSDRVFNCTNASSYGKRVSKILKIMSNECDIPLVTLHGLRHTCGTVLRENGTDIYSISKFLGHSSIGVTTKIYVHNDVEVMRRAIFRDSNLTTI